MNENKSEIRTVLVTGNLGYIGSVLTPRLAGRGYRVIGYDSGLYGEPCRLFPLESGVVKQVGKDIRDMTVSDLEGVDAVIHLAALSNDPLGELAPNITEEINYHGAMRVAECAKAAGVGRFLYASSQSMYGIADTSDELDEDRSTKNPITAYAKTKWAAECDLRALAAPGFAVTFMRPSTVFGASPKLRCDVVYNNLVACAFTTGHIEIKSDGTPWRPVVHVEDVAGAFIAGLEAPLDLVAGEAFNIGIPNGNFTVRQLAEAAQQAVPESSLVFTGEHGSDARTYRVSFAKILSRLGEYFKPRWDLAAGGRELVGTFGRIAFTEGDFRGRKCNRLPHLKQLLETGKLSENLRWVE